MSSAAPAPNPAHGAESSAVAARRILREALKGALATLDRETGHPYASLVLTATEPDGSPILLISQLARHSRNLADDPRASLLLDATDGLGDPLGGGRLTLIGEARPGGGATAQARFLCRHPSAASYAGFADFSVYTIAVSGGHYIGGFGRIVDLAPADLLTSTSDAGPLIAAEPDIVAHMNGDHADAIALYATALAGGPAGAWRMSGIDPDGIDLLLCDRAARIAFPAPVRTPGEARAALVALAQNARERSQRIDLRPTS